MLALEWNPDVILAVAALLTATAGILSAIAAIRRTKKNTKRDAEEECLQRLRIAREEAETLAKEVHDHRMKANLG